MGMSLICRRNISFAAIDLSYCFTECAHWEEELYDVALEGSGFPVVFDGLNVDVSRGLELVPFQIGRQFRVNFGSHAIVGTAEIDADEETAGENGDLGGILLGGEGNEVFPCRAEVFGKEAVLPEDPTGGSGAKGMAIKEPLRMFGEGGDPVLRVAVCDRRADEEPLHGQGEGLKDV